MWVESITKVALTVCRGKTSPMYQPSMDMGSYVVIINAEKVKVTGNKEQQKMYYRHTGRPGSLKEENFRKLQAVCLLAVALRLLTRADRVLSWQGLAATLWTAPWQLEGARTLPAEGRMPQSGLLCSIYPPAVQGHISVIGSTTEF